MPDAITFEKRPGGTVTAAYDGGQTETIARVVSAVRGIGRFGGSQFADVGRLRANHPGVIAVSTSPLGSMGAFQIIPHHHAKGLGFDPSSGQWMVLRPEDASVDGLEGMPPLFAGYLQPRYTPNWYKQDDWLGSLLSRYRCDVRRGEGGWERTPELSVPRPDTELPEWAFDCLAEVSHLGIRTPTLWQH